MPLRKLMKPLAAGLRLKALVLHHLCDTNICHIGVSRLVHRASVAPFPNSLCVHGYSHWIDFLLEIISVLAYTVCACTERIKLDHSLAP